MQPRKVDYPDAPEAAKVVVYAENQPEYLPLPVLRLPNGEILSRWVLSDDERRLIAETGEMYLTVCTFNHPDGLQPVMLTVQRPCIKQQEVRGQTVMYFSPCSEPETVAPENAEPKTEPETGSAWSGLSGNAKDLSNSIFQYLDDQEWGQRDKAVTQWDVARIIESSGCLVREGNVQITALDNEEYDKITQMLVEESKPDSIGEAHEVLKDIIAERDRLRAVYLKELKDSI